MSAEAEGRLRVGVFGGSFNPPHVAHVLAAQYALLVAPIDRVLVVPVFQHPFAKELASFEQRLTMCRLAFADLERVEVSDLERRLGGESKTLRTLEHLAAAQPDWQLRLLIGADVVADLPKWHRFDRIAELAPPFVFARRGSRDNPGPAVLPEVSSTEVRELFAQKDAAGLRALVPRAVLAFAERERLYGERPA